MKKILFLVGFALLLGLTVLYARGKNEKITGIYSSMFYHEEAGDVLGVEAFIVFTKRGYYVLLQQSEGEPEIPVLVPLKVDNKQISFTLPDTIMGYTGIFNGEIKNDRLIGYFHTNNENRKKIELKRKSSYWQ